MDLLKKQQQQKRKRKAIQLLLFFCHDKTHLLQKNEKPIIFHPSNRIKLKKNAHSTEMPL